MNKIKKIIFEYTGVFRSILLGFYFISSFFACYYFLQFKDFKFSDWFQIYLILLGLEILSRLILAAWSKNFEWKKMFVVIVLLSIIFIFPAWLFTFLIARGGH